MGYKLAGFDVIGCNEIDPRMNKCYVENHHPKYNFLCDIREMVQAVDLPAELYNLDVLDGSPPCSTFSTAGIREKAWGKEKHFREGQAAQVLDTLFFDYIALAKKLQPKVVIAENVKGLLLGSAMDYVGRIYEGFDDAGYYCQHFLLDGSKMGLPQRRQRVFFVCIRKDIGEKFLEQDGFFDFKPSIDMNFNENPITCRDCNLELGDQITKCYKQDYDRLQNGKKKKYQQSALVDLDDVHPTILASYKYKASPMPKWECKWLSRNDICKLSSFPLDYEFLDNKAEYLCGMSVPPVMMAQVASRVWEYWLSKI